MASDYFFPIPVVESFGGLVVRLFLDCKTLISEITADARCHDLGPLDPNVVLSVTDLKHIVVGHGY